MFCMFLTDMTDMSHGTIFLFNRSFLKHSELLPSWVLNVTEILESLIPAFIVHNTNKP